MENFEPIFVENQDHEQGFANYYECHIKTIAVEHDKHRFHIIKKIKRNIYISCLILGLYISIILYALSFENGTIFLMFSNEKVIITYHLAIVLVAIGVTIPTLAFLPKYSYNTKVRKEIYPKILEFFNGTTYKYKPKIPSTIKQILKKCSIVPNYFYCVVQDQIELNYNNHNIDIFEILFFSNHPGCYLESAPKRRVVKTFMSNYIFFSLGKTLRGETIIFNKERDNFFIKLISSSSYKKNKNMELVEIQHLKFNQLFVVYSSNKHESTCLVNEQMIDNILYLVRISPKNMCDIEFSFYENYMIMKSTRLLGFLPNSSIHKQKDFVQESRNVLQEIHMVFNIFDRLIGS